MTQQEYLKLIDEVIEKGRYKDDWASLSGHKAPQWFTQGKLGIFIHFGLYAVAGFGNEWYSRSMYDKRCREYQYHRDTFGPQDKFGYKDFIPLFTLDKFNADEWAQLFKSSGAKYVMPVAEHHDGFSMYNTAFNPWNICEMGAKRDYLGELKSSLEKSGLTFCASTHRAEHYFFMNPGMETESDIKNGEAKDFYGPAVYNDAYCPDNMTASTWNIEAEGPTDEYLTDWMVRTLELVDRYQPSSLYFDWWIHNNSFKPYLKKIAAYYYNRAEEWGKEVTINYKLNAFPPAVATFDVERGALKDISPVPWQTCTSVSRRSWGYIKDNEFKKSEQIICDFVDIVSKNGSLLLNIGPAPDGTIVKEEADILRDIGKWLETNGEGIYGSTFWKKFGEGDTNVEEGFFKDNDNKDYTAKDFRFTYKNGCIYAFQMKPDGKPVEIKSLYYTERAGLGIKSISLLGSKRAVSYERDENSLIITDYEKTEDKAPICFKIELI
ncbi:MAG: alpha-L-fucosidase [Clostridia bacterium]|nr:alpha-L-fucosidase [Clostridia bacterium]